MAEFAWRYSYVPKLAAKPRVDEAAMGDGYVQASAVGLNTMAEVWSLTFDDLTDVEREEILSFFDVRKGATAFTWVNPRGLTKSYVCKDWNWEVKDEDLNTITATFNQRFGV